MTANRTDKFIQKDRRITVSQIFEICNLSAGTVHTLYASILSLTIVKQAHIYIFGTQNTRS